MKMNFAMIILCCIAACNNYHNNSDKGLSELQTESDKAKRDSFIYHFHLLDSLAQANVNDTVYVGVTSSIEFMEVNTQIESHSEGTLVGKIKFFKRDLKEWHDWFDTNYNKKK